MKRRAKTLLLSCMTIVMSVMVLIAGSFALFSEDKNVRMHLIAGSLDAKLERTALVTTKLNEKGYLVTVEEQTAEDAAVPFTEETTANVFGLGANEKIVPCTVLSATMCLTNDGDVAFGYWLEIKAEEGYETSELAKQIKITVTPGNGEASKSQYVSDGLSIGSSDDMLGTIEVGKAATFTVKIEFESRSDNNAAQNAETIFDLIVHATQETDDPNS
ncbi:MAG: hypothetical protein IJZ32_03980 [Clostridia bacterium]|nr:hypothetical protein [Clostridia bacterium]